MEVREKRCVGQRLLVRRSLTFATPPKVNHPILPHRGGSGLAEDDLERFCRAAAEDLDFGEGRAIQLQVAEMNAEGHHLTEHELTRRRDNSRHQTVGSVLVLSKHALGKRRNRIHDAEEILASEKTMSNEPESGPG